MTNNAPRSLELQARDERLFFGLLESRVMTRDQLAGLYFDGNYEIAKKRLAKLTRSGFILERKPRANPGHYFPSLLSLGRKGFDALRAGVHLASFPNMKWDDLVDRVQLAQSTLMHEVELIEHRLAITTAFRTHPVMELLEFLTWPALFQFHTEELLTRKPFILKPDAFFMASHGDAEHSFFMEYDRAKEAGRQLMKKAWGYHCYYSGGGFARRNGAPKEDFKEHPFRVLYVFPNEERRNAMAERLLQVHRPEDKHSRIPALLKNQHWLTTSAACLGDPLGPIWLTLGEYWRITEGTLYDPRQHFTTTRVTARDRFTRAHAALRSLFTQPASKTTQEVS